MMSDFQSSFKGAHIDIESPTPGSSSVLDRNPYLGENIRDHPLFNMGLTPINKMNQFEKLLPPVEEHIYALEPLVKKQFNLFSSHI